jgi:ABC-2 type transport system permease protein
MRAAYWVWRRELAVTLRAPIIYVIGGLFLVVQGIAFAGLVGALSDPRRPAPLGALLEGQLAGTLLTWVLQLVVLTLLGMRTIADERRSGGWELLLTARVGEGAAVVGKWLAAATIYALIWLPTLAYLAIVAVFRSDPGGWDVASIACGYAGAIALGAALLAWAVAASAATSTTLAAGGLGFALLVALFLVGELPSIWPDLGTDHPAIAHVLAGISLRARLTAFARGEVSLASIAFVVALAVTGLSLAIALACAGRRRRREVAHRVVATALVALIGVLACVVATQHPRRWDVSATRRNSLDPATRSVIAELPLPATLTIIEPTLGALDTLYAEVGRVADRMAEVGAIHVRHVDPAALPGGIDAAARVAGLQPRELAANGGVVVDVGDRRRIVDVLELATIDRGEGGAPAFEQLAIERALAGALAELSTAQPLTVCATRLHGELSLVDAITSTIPHVTGLDWKLVGDRLRADGMTLAEIERPAELAPCAAVLVIGPMRPLEPAWALALQQYARGGGGVLVAAASRPVPGGPELSPTGLESMLAAEGLGLPSAIAVDPTLAIRELPGALLIVDGYSAHEVNAGFVAARRTLWTQPRAVTTTHGATPLVATTAAGWGETDLEHGPPAKDPDDLAGPIAVAALGSTHRVIALGSAESMSSAAMASGAAANDLWVAHAVRFLVGRPQPAPDVAVRSGEQVRLVMTAGERRTVMALSIAGIPLAWLVLGGGLVAWRRRRSAA